MQVQETLMICLQIISLENEEEGKDCSHSLCGCLLCLFLTRFEQHFPLDCHKPTKKQQVHNSENS